jgi:putative DNA primase/helicase
MTAFQPFTRIREQPLSRRVLETLTGSARVLLGQAEALEDPTERAAWQEAQDWLREVLAAGPRKASEVQKDARGAGISDKSLRAAREKMGIKPHKETTVEHGAWHWRLPRG